MRSGGWRAERCVVRRHGLYPESLRNLQKLVISGVGGEGLARATRHLCAFAGCHGLGSWEAHGIYVMRHSYS